MKNEDKMQPGRRQFLKGSLAASGAILVGQQMLGPQAAMAVEGPWRTPLTAKFEATPTGR